MSLSVVRLSDSFSVTRLSKQMAYYTLWMVYGLGAWLIAFHAVVTEALHEGVGHGTVFTSSWVIGWGNVLSTQVLSTCSTYSMYLLCSTRIDLHYTATCRVRS